MVGLVYSYIIIVVLTIINYATLFAKTKQTHALIVHFTMWYSLIECSCNEPKFKLWEQKYTLSVFVYHMSKSAVFTEHHHNCKCDIHFIKQFSKIKIIFSFYFRHNFFCFANINISIHTNTEEPLCLFQWCFIPEWNCIFNKLGKLIIQWLIKISIELVKYRLVLLLIKWTQSILHSQSKLQVRYSLMPGFI